MSPNFEHHAAESQATASDREQEFRSAMGDYVAGYRQTQRGRRRAISDERRPFAS